METLSPKAVKLILQEHLRHRMCPPPAGVPENELKEHLALCPLCEDWVYVFGDLGGEELPFDNMTPGSGQVWKISRTLEGWEDGRRIYYNSPYVMVINVWDKVARVAMVHDEDLLATSEDVPFKGLFIEPWNTFSIPTKYLARFLLDASEVLDIVRRKAETGLIPEPSSFMQATFIETEIRVASYFALKVLNEVMELEGSTDLLDSLAWEEEETLFPFLPPDTSGSSLINRLAAYQPPEAMLPLAAAGEEEPGEPIVVTVVEFKNDKPSVKTAMGYVTFISQSGEELIFGGKIICPLSPDAGIHAVLLDKVTNNIIMPAVKANLDPAGGFFRVVFSPVTDDIAKRGKLGLLVGTL